MHDCPHCGETIDLSTDDRGTRRSYRGAAIDMVEMGRDVCLRGHCRSCNEQVTVWAQIDVVKA